MDLKKCADEMNEFFNIVVEEDYDEKHLEIFSMKINNN